MSSSSDFLKNYELAEPTIRKLYDSKLRLAILESLKDKPLRLADLRRAVNANAPNTSSKAKELEEMGLLERVGGDFQLTPYGRVVRARTEATLGVYSAYEKFKKFWKGGELSAIPDVLWDRIGELKNAQLIRGTSVDIMESEEEYVKMLCSAKKRFYGVTPLYHEGYLDAVQLMVSRGVQVKLVVTTGVLTKCAECVGVKGAKEIDKMKNWEFYEIRNPRVCLAVSEVFLTLVLGRVNTEPSHMFIDEDLRSTDPVAIQWGLDLFEYYKKQAKPVKLSDYL